MAGPIQRHPKRSIKPPLIGIGVGAAVLGAAGAYGLTMRGNCSEGRVIESLAQCKSVVGFQHHALCEQAFTRVQPSRSGVADSAVFVTTARGNDVPQVAPLIRNAGEVKWRMTSSQALVEPYRNNCSSSRSGSGSSGGSSARSWGGGDSGGSSTTTGTDGAHGASRGGFGGTAMSFFSRGS
ncbi:MAG: hypothetical protein ACRCYS_05645 [Beijerinckiaceae bacterium]